MDNNTNPVNGAAPAAPEAPVAGPAPAGPAAAPVAGAAAPAAPATPGAPAINQTASIAGPSAPVTGPITPVAGAAKKSKAPLIAGCCIGAVVVAGGIFGGIAFAKNQPEAVAFDAFTNAMSADKLAYTATVNLSPKDSGESFESASLELKGFSSFKDDIIVVSDVQLNIKPKSIDNISLALGGAFAKDGKLYIRVDKLSDTWNTVKPLLKQSGVDISAVESLIDSIIGKINGQWWKVDVSEVVDKLSLGSEGEKIKKAYNCVSDYIGKSADRQEALTNLYKENPFIEIEKYDRSNVNSEVINGMTGNTYELDFNAEKLTNYYNGLKDASDADSLVTCLNDSGAFGGETLNTDDLFSEVKVEDVAKSLEGSKAKVIVSIDGFLSHKLTGIYMDISEAEGNANGYVYFKVDQDGNNPVDFNAGDAKSILELGSVFTEAFDSYIDEYAQAEWQKNGAYYQAAGYTYETFKEAYKEQFEKTLAEQFSKGVMSELPGGGSSAGTGVNNYTDDEDSYSDNEDDYDYDDDYDY